MLFQFLATLLSLWICCLLVNVVNAFEFVLFDEILHADVCDNHKYKRYDKKKKKHVEVGVEVRSTKAELRSKRSRLSRVSCAITIETESKSMRIF